MSDRTQIDGSLPREERRPAVLKPSASAGEGLFRRARAVVAPLARAVYWTATSQLVRGFRQRKYERLIRRSRLFQEDFYLAQCAGDRSARRNPVAHYLRRGAAAGLDPNPFFHTRFYLQQNPDAASAGKNPLVHYIRRGAPEGLAPSPLFDGVYYAERHPEALDPRWPCPLVHYLEQGRAEGASTVRPEGADLVPDLLEWAARHDVRQATRVLVLDDGSWLGDPGSSSMLAVLRELRKTGIEVTLGVEGGSTQAGQRELEALGVLRLYGAESIGSHLLASGQLYGTALFLGSGVARRYLPLVRAHALWARAVYDPGCLQKAPEPRAEPGSEERARARGDLVRALDPLAAAADATFTFGRERTDGGDGKAVQAAVEVLGWFRQGAPAPQSGCEAEGRPDRGPGPDGGERGPVPPRRRWPP